MKKISIAFALTTGLLVPQMSLAEIGIQTALTCINPDTKVKVEVQVIPTTDEPKLPKVTFIGVETPAAVLPSALVEKEVETTAGKEYRSNSVNLVIKKGTGTQREAIAQIQGKKVELVCHAPFTYVCGNTIVSDTGSGPFWVLAVENPFFPKVKEMVAQYTLVAPPAVLANLKRDKLFCFEGTFAGAKNSFSVQKVVNKSPIVP